MIYVCSICQAKFRYDGQGEVICPSCGGRVRLEGGQGAGCAWDEAGKGTWANAFLNTLKRSMFEPSSFFRQASAGQGWIRPLLFAFIIAVVAFAVTAAYQAGFRALESGVRMYGADVSAWPFIAYLAAVPFWVMLISSVAIAPVVTAVALLVQTTLYHLCLMLLGAAKGGYARTFRVVCYSAGPQILQIVPFVGAVVASVWQMVLAIIGLKEVHQTSYGRSAVAVFLPMIVCCSAVVLMIVAIAGGVVAAIATSAGQ